MKKWRVQFTTETTVQLVFFKIVVVLRCAVEVPMCSSSYQIEYKMTNSAIWCHCLDYSYGIISFALVMQMLIP